LVILAYTLGDQTGRAVGWGPIRAAVLLGIVLVLSVVALRSTVELSFYRQSLGTELLAQDTATTNLREQARRIANLSRDINGTDRSPSNPAGGKEMTIRLDRTVQWPFRWYFRDFPNLVMTAPGAAPAEDAQLVIAPDPAGMTEAGYQPKTIDTVTTPSSAYLDPSLGTVLKHIFVPSNWDEGMKFVLYRNTIQPAAPRTVTFGYASDVVSVMTGERPTYGLYDRAGAGINPGQFNQPRGVAVSPDGLQAYVLDTQNNRIQIFSTDSGELLGIWGDGEGDDVSLALTDNGLGPYGLTVGPEGLIYIADTWNHRIVVVSPDGQVVRTFGEFGNNEDSPDPAPNPSMFYGPRALAVHGDEIFVSDTGNERIQVFGLDGAFRRSFGGTGSGPNQLLEPVGVAVGEDGTVYVADSGNARISLFTADGAPVAQWMVPQWLGNQFFEPYLAIGPDGNIYAGSPLTASIVVFAPDGTVVDEIVDADGDPLQLPAGLAFGPEGILYIADRGASEIYTLSVDTTSDDEVVEMPGTTDGSPVASPQASPEGSPVASPAP
ncbi:MAG: NHL repeat-containing protein, partial [Chloroflexota bacterium]|nr:NHL repeat-containing protein [Chloroflexota bacterium]